MKGFPDLPPIWWGGSIGVVSAGRWLAPSWHIEIPGQIGAACVVAAGALGLLAWSATWFRKKRTTIEPHKRPSALIVEGPYRLSRNPIYLAFVLMTLAATIGLGSIVGLAAVFALWWVLDRRFAAEEEKYLQAVFGGAAQDYLAGTRRWF